MSGTVLLLVLLLQILSRWPRIVLYPNFVDAERARQIVSIAKSHLQPSDLMWKPGQKVDPRQDMRTSSGVFMAPDDDPTGTLKWMEEKISAITMLPTDNMEVILSSVLNTMRSVSNLV